MESSNALRNRNISLDILRILACLGVITIHSAGSVDFHHLADVGTLYWNIGMAMDVLCRWSVPVFCMLTGFFFLNPRKELSLKNLYCKYILHIVIVLVVWSLFYAITLHQRLYPWGKQSAHLWYLSMCIGLYMAMPILRWIAGNKEILAYFCWVWLGCKIYDFIGNFITLPVTIIDHLFVDYVGYCLWGYYLSLIQLTRRQRVLLSIAGIVCAGLSVLGYLFSKDACSCWASYVSVPNIVISLSIFYVFLHWHPHMSDLGMRLISKISTCTEGIYMVHIWILTQIFFRIYRFVPNLLLTIVLSIVITFISGGGVIVLIIKQIPVLKRWIV